MLIHGLHYSLLIIVFVFYSCTNRSSETTENTESYADTIHYPTHDSLEIVTEKESSNGRPDIYSQFDLQDFKSLSRSSHSSPYKLEGHFYSLADFGHYSYYYFLGQHYITRKSEYPSQEEFYILTALKKPFKGDEQYMEMEEELVILQCKVNDTNLCFWNFVGMKKNELDSIEFGNTIDSSSSFRLFAFENECFRFQLKDSTISEFRYMKFSENFEYLFDSLGNEVFEF